jgi:hypothetical protein
MEADSDESEYNVSGTEDDDVEPRPPLQGSTSSEPPTSPEYSARTSEHYGTVGNVEGQQLQPTQWSLST